MKLYFGVTSAIALASVVAGGSLPNTAEIRDGLNLRDVSAPPQEPYRKTWPPYTYSLGQFDEPREKLAVWDLLNTVCLTQLEWQKQRYHAQLDDPYPTGVFSCKDPSQDSAFRLERLINEPTWHMSFGQIQETLTNLTETVYVFGDSIPNFSLEIYLGELPFGIKVARGAWGRASSAETQLSHEDAVSNIGVE